MPAASPAGFAVTEIVWFVFMLPEGEMVSQFVPPLCIVVLATKVVVLGDDTVSCCVEEEPFTDVLKVSADVLSVN